MADYEPMRRSGAARKKKICICVGVSVVLAVAAAAVVLAMFYWKSDVLVGSFFGRNATNFTTPRPARAESNYSAAFAEDQVSFDVTMRITLPKESGEGNKTARRRSVDCTGAKLKEICGGGDDFKACDQDKLKDYLQEYVAGNFKAKLAENADKDPLFSGVKSTKLDIELYNVEKTTANAKAKVTVTYNKILPKIAVNESDAETPLDAKVELQKLVDKIKESFDACPNHLAAAEVKYGLQSYDRYQDMKAMEPFVGEWELVSSEKFNEALEVLGVGFFKRTMAISAKPKSIIKYNDETNEWTFVVSSPLRTLTTKFEVGKEFNEILPNDSDGKSTVVVQDGKFIQTQKTLNGDLVSVQTRELTGKDEYMLTIDVGKYVAKRGYRRIKA